MSKFGTDVGKSKLISTLTQYDLADFEREQEFLRYAYSTAKHTWSFLKLVLRFTHLQIIFTTILDFRTRATKISDIRDFKDTSVRKVQV